MKPAPAFIHDLHIAEIFLASLMPHPHPGISVVVPARSPKSVVKALRHVADYLRKEQKAVQKAA